MKSTAERVRALRKRRREAGWKRIEVEVRTEHEALLRRYVERLSKAQPELDARGR